MDTYRKIPNHVTKGLPFDLHMDHQQRQHLAMRKTIWCRGLSQKVRKRVYCYYYTGKCYFNLIPKMGILWVGCISLLQQQTCTLRCVVLIISIKGELF